VPEMLCIMSHGSSMPACLAWCGLCVVEDNGEQADDRI
jgi:hypothetical protein